MFDAIRKLWRNAKIEFDYPRYEDAARSAHRISAETRFSTQALQAEMDGLMGPHRSRCEEEFGSAIAAMSKAVARLDDTIATMRQQVELLQTDYAAILDPMYERSREIAGLWRDALAEKRKGHDDLETARSDISDWHSKSSSNGLFGNGGRELPRHALFGQSFGDLDDYKSNREDAVKAIRQASTELSALKHERDNLQAQIADAKECRARQRELLATGVRLPGLRDRLRRTIERREEQRELLLRTDAARDEMLRRAWHTSGAQSVQEAIDAADAARARHLAEFDTPVARKARRQAHWQDFAG